MDVCDPLKNQKSFSPLTNKEFDSLVEPLLGFLPKGFSCAVGVSGGPDSLALTLLLHQWIQKQQGTLTALTVDHGLRQESAQEARQVGAWLKAYGITHVILTTPPWHSETKIQEKARNLRYYLLESYCFHHGIDGLFLGHHLQDQWETFIQRLSHKSGLKGLTCMKPISKNCFVTKYRPLLDVPKERLIEALRVLGQPFIQDPSNADPRFLRSQTRSALTTLTSVGLTPATIQGSLYKLQKVQQCLDNLGEKAYAQTTYMSPLGYAVIDITKLITFPPEIAQRLFESLCLKIFPAPYPPKSKVFDALLESLYPATSFKNATTANPPSSQRFDTLTPRTLSVQGTLFYQTKTSLWVMRAPHRKNQRPTCLPFPSLELYPLQGSFTKASLESTKSGPSHQTYLWDHRFLLQKANSLSQNSISQWCIAPLGKVGLLTLKKKNCPLEKIPRAIYETLPALWNGERLVSVPHLNFGLNDWIYSQWGSAFPKFLGS